MQQKTLDKAEAGGRESPKHELEPVEENWDKDYDPRFSTGTLATTTLDDSERLEAAWWYEMWLSPSTPCDMCLTLTNELRRL